MMRAAEWAVMHAAARGTYPVVVGSDEIDFAICKIHEAFICMERRLSSDGDKGEVRLTGLAG